MKWMEDAREAFVPVEYLNGFCLGFWRDRFLALGGFDTDGFPHGYGEETDLCLRNVDSGGANLVATHIYVPHAKTRSYTQELRSQLAEVGRVTLAARFGSDFMAASRSAIRSNRELRDARSRMRRLYKCMGATEP